MPEATSGCDAHCDELDFSARLRFAETLPGEYEEIHERRANAGTDDPPTPNGRPRKVRALSLSGGGIRSATFNLGFLQALHAARKLTTFDYLSTVSGGGYTGGWWSAWLSRRQVRPEVFPPPEDFETERDDLRAVIEERSMREDFERQQVNDSSLTAGIDPIHHLRLFSNFLTPHKGLLSSDTWRAIAIIGRNLVLTWLTLLPIVLAVIMLGQSWFAVAPPTQEGFRWRPDLGRYVTSQRTSGQIGAEPAERQQRDPRDLKTRLVWALLLPALLFVGSVVCVTLWMVANRRCWSFRDIVVVILGGLAWVLLTWIFTKILTVKIAAEFLIALAVWFVIIGILLAVWQKRHQALASDIDFWKNRIVNLQTTLLQYSVFIAVVLLFAAFGYEFVDFLLFNQTLSSDLGARLGRTGGWTGVAAAVFSSLYTAMKATPRGGEDRAARKGPPPRLERIAFAIAPPLFVIVIGLGLAWVGHRLYTTVYQDTNEQLWFAIIGSLISAILFLIFALYEFRPPQKWKNLIVVTIWLAISVGQYFLPMDFVQANLVKIGIVSSIMVAVMLALRAFVTRSVPVVVGAAAVAGVAVFLLLFFYRVGAMFVLQRSHIPQLVVGGIVATLALLIFELIAGRGSNTRSLGLMTVAFLILVLLGAAACAGSVAWQSMAMVALIATILGWVLSFGWLADPNALTVHGFYKARLVRAYLGASNDRRHGADADITDAVPGDDVMLVDLENTEHGAPYHLITTTLNLVGARDLATQQRFSDAFLMSKRYCGSFRTGFRRTEQYACGTLSLGTAVAVSGAAASPEMGAQTPSAALVALLTFFNVRLGYWAPTPNRSYWRSGSARLWPIYTLQELLSQTTDLLPFCYLTDGGHFDNSGVYPLVQRGCNFILYSDCGADPDTTLDDLGNLMRKVRIDFGTEIVFDDLENFRNNPPKSHFVTGKVYYSAEHAASIGLSPEERVGTIVIVKPNRTAGASADVQQYGWTNATYPQQSTADLWYDEAQFESYRRLGEISGAAAIAAGLV